ncbi:MAG: VCBS repeat-containing protein [Verrucomicrobiota bacterium]
MTNRAVVFSFQRLLAGLLVVMSWTSIFVSPGKAQSFTNVPIAGLQGVNLGSVAWGDYDNDGRLDFLITGYGASYTTQLWRNTGSGFSNVTASVAPGLLGVSQGAVAWADYDNDGRLDFFLTGVNNVTPISQLWRNTGNGFTNVTASVAPGLPGVFDSSIAWADYDNDGRLDFLLTGNYNGSAFSQLWRNTGSGFTNVTVSVAPGLPGVHYGSVVWGDYDNDGRPDFLLTGNLYTSNNVSQLWRNTGSGFIDVTGDEFPTNSLPGVGHSSVTWGDYDNDGRLDFLLMGGVSGSTPVSQLWRNTGNGFTNVSMPGLPGLQNGSVAWGDYDNDGRLDFFLTGSTNSSSFSSTGMRSQLWRNTGNGFTNVTGSEFLLNSLADLSESSVAWGDYDNDGRLDFLVAGVTDSDRASQLWHNNTPTTNTLPTAPTGLAVSGAANVVTLSWNAASDAQTPTNGLGYNVRCRHHAKRS